MTEKWDKEALCDYIKVLISNFKGDKAYVNFYSSRVNNSLDIEIMEVKE